MDNENCSFCTENPPMMGLGEGRICARCYEMLFKQVNPEPTVNFSKEELLEELRLNILPPRRIHNFLDEYIIGQTQAKKVLSVGVFEHYQRILYPSDEVQLEKNNLMLIGGTGTGKTLLAKTIARILKVPFSIGDATTITEAGYVGEDVENLLAKLVNSVDGDIEKAKLGIVYIDEVDKIAKRSGNVSITRDVSGEGVQQSLLKLVEGTIASLPPIGGRKHPEQKLVQMDTTNILFICGGTFSGIEDIISQRLGKTKMGFRTNLGEEIKENEILEHISTEDLVQYGMIPEFIGRFPVIRALQKLTVSDLVRILTEPKNSLVRQYTHIFNTNKCGLKFETKALEHIAECAIKKETGARGLRAIFDSFMTDIMYEMPEHPGADYCITEKIVKGIDKVHYEH